MNPDELPEPLHALSSLNVLLNELAAYRSTGSPLHLAHAARALDDARAELEIVLVAAAPPDAKKDVAA